MPYVVALVNLDNGVRMPTNIVGCAPEAITPGMPIEVTFKPVTDAVTLPLFQPAA